MRLSRPVVLAGAAFLALSAAAYAQSSDTHVMTVRLPNGAIEQIRYSGDVPPRIVVMPAAAEAESPFAMLARMSARMDRQAEAMMRAFDAPVTEAALGPLPSGFCMHSVRITYTGTGQPRMESQTSGDCGPGEAVPAQHPVPAAPARDQRTIEVKAGSPYQNLVQPVGAWRG